MVRESSFIITHRDESGRVLVEVKTWRPVSDKYLGVGCDEIDRIRARVINQLDIALENFREKIKKT